jgi:hypothetical protein
LGEIHGRRTTLLGTNLSAAKNPSIWGLANFHSKKGLVIICLFGVLRKQETVRQWKQAENELGKAIENIEALMY